MRIKKLIKLFEKNNVCVCGLRGRGKDILFGNVVARSLCPYVSNVDYTKDKNFQLLSLEKINVKNTYTNFINGDYNFYEFPYKIASDIFISDVGVYFPSQYCGELNKKFPTFPIYNALSRQISNNHVHFNCQNLNRVWDKFREMSDIYIMCNKCIFIFNTVILNITIYDKYQSALDRVKPCKITKPLLNKEVKYNVEMYKDNFYNTYGSVKNYTLIFKNKSKHNTLLFGGLLRNGKK